MGIIWSGLIFAGEMCMIIGGGDGGFFSPILKSCMVRAWTTVYI